MKVYFSHGKESGPWGTKIKRLATIAIEQGHKVESIDYTDIPDPDLRVDHLLNVLNQSEDDFALVGSSMGGYVSLVASERVEARGVFLLAPALYIPGYKNQIYSMRTHVEIVHGWSDEVIPPDHSIDFARRVGCSLHLISGDHRLNASLEVIEGIFRQFLFMLAAHKTAERAG